MSENLNLKDFSYTLPEHLIAQQPIPNRDGSRLMLLNRRTGAYTHKMFADIVDLLQPGDCLVINDTKVIPARMRGHFREGGAPVEILLHQRLAEDRWEALCKPSKKCPPGTKLVFGDGAIVGTIDGVIGDSIRAITMAYQGDWETLLDQYGEMPLPPYIKETSDKDRYQTVYAEHEGSVAAPTAGLHFTEAILAQLEAKGIDIARITLHVGLGTFQPVRTEDITEHHMHSEYYRVTPEAAAKLNRTKELDANGQRRGRIIAVGTTSCRTLESCVGDDGKIIAGTGWTDIYIYPGFEFRAIDGLLTNFHLPESTLIMLVSAFCNREAVLAAYEAAVAEEYRFYSFGDAMFLH